MVRPVSTMSSTSSTCFPSMGRVRSLVICTTPLVLVPWYELMPMKSTESGRSMARTRSARKMKLPFSTPSTTSGSPAYSRVMSAPIAATRASSSCSEISTSIPRGVPPRPAGRAVGAPPRLAGSPAPSRAPFGGLRALSLRRPGGLALLALSLDIRVVHDLPEAAAAGDDVLVVVEPALLVPAGAGDGGEHVGRGEAAVEPDRVDVHVRVGPGHGAQVLGRHDEVDVH